MVSAYALTALLTLPIAPQGAAATQSVFDRLSGVAATILGTDENSRYYLKVGGITRGAGLSLGPGVRLKGLAGGWFDAYAFVALSHRKYLLAETTLAVSRLGVPGLRAGVFARRKYFPQEDFFGIGTSSLRDDRVNYAYDENAGGAFVTFKPAGALTLGGRLEYRDPDVGRGHDDAVPSIEQRFDAVAVPGLAAQPDFLVAAASADLGTATPENRPRRGGRYLASVSRFADRGSARCAFTLFEADLRQYVPLVPGRHLLVFRASASLTRTSGSNHVPFYYLPTLGGGSSLRGFRDFRFHDRQMLLVQGEYRWLVVPFVEAALFYDAGTVAPRVSGLGVDDVPTDYGVGLRLGTAARVFARLDAAFGSREGTRVFFKFSNEF